MKIAVVGGGISGLAAAYLLSEDHEITLFEANHYAGGHTRTVKVGENGGALAVDTGFMVFNDWTYPNFVKLLNRLGVDSQPTCMSFSVSCERTRLEYNGTSVNKLFAQRRNLLRPRFLGMIREILRFNREAKRQLDCEERLTVGGFLAQNGYGEEFINRYLVPMSASIWSARPEKISDFPLRFFVRFLDNHGMLSVNDRPQWRVVKGGSSVYVEKLTRSFRDRIRLRTPVERIRRLETGVEVRSHGGWESFDEAVLAVHSDQALRMLENPTPEERSILGAIAYQANDTVLHTDARLLPRSRRAWASWNCRLPAQPADRIAVTYYSNRLQSLNSQRHYCVSLNQASRIDPSLVIEKMLYHHPVFSPEAGVAQRSRDRISGRNRTHYCGAYWGYGFHEDGLNSALAVCRRFGKGL